MFNDESGFLLAPLLRTTQAWRGRTPVLVQRAAHRDKVSVAASLWKTPGHSQVRLHYQIYPNAYLTAQDYADYLGELLQGRLRGQPVIVLQDQGNMHRGEPMEELLEDLALLHIEPLPAYAPELNPVEALWHHVKYDALANFAPQDVPDLSAVLNQTLGNLYHDQARLQTFLSASPLQW
jgi:transposase